LLTLTEDATHGKPEDRTVDGTIDGFGQMKLKSEFVKKS
ncbi:TPA: PhnA domain-containing protein, partial [Serratia rubidaea]|nr:PhnA domain-containing protein [Serratia rubidaea]